MKKILFTIALFIPMTSMADIDVYLDFGNLYYRPPVYVTPQYVPQYLYHAPVYIEPRYQYQELRPTRRRRDWDDRYYHHKHKHHHHDND